MNPLDTPLFTGKLVRLAVEETQVMAEAFSRWFQNSEYTRLLDSAPARLFSVKQSKEWVEKELSSEKPDLFQFSIRTLADDRLIGEIGLDGVDWSHRDTFLGIGLGEPDYWGKGYGTDAMRIILRYAFNELNLHRVSLNVFGYNERAIQCYCKVGFVEEGRARQFLRREGRRWDILYMGILRPEWEAANPEWVAPAQAA